MFVCDIQFFGDAYMYSTSTVPRRPMMLSKQRTPLRVRLRRIVGRNGDGVGVDYFIE